MKLNEPMTPHAEKAMPFDAAKYLDSDEAIAEYPAEALDTGDSNTIAHAIGVAARAQANRKRQ
jgi:probable addiction module antidote protein